MLSNVHFRIPFPDELGSGNDTTTDTAVDDGNTDVRRFDIGQGWRDFCPNDIGAIRQLCYMGLVTFGIVSPWH
jgi:hypothetical protein